MAASLYPILRESPVARPVLKWAGGKQQMLDNLLPKIPKRFSRYIEPFVGGGALFFALSPSNAIIADSNPDLINLYNVIATDVDALIDKLKKYKTDVDTFYRVRGAKVANMSDVQRAARTLYLNRTCFNGLYRVNKHDQFNVPYGKYKNPRICDVEGLHLAHAVLKNTRILCKDYKELLLEVAREGDFVYLDPPYLPISQFADFKRYTKEQFGEVHHRELADVVRILQKRGCYVVVTNSNHPLVYELYGEFDIEVVQTRRNINSIASKRGNGEDVVIQALPAKRTILTLAPPPLSQQVDRYPGTRFMGSKQDLLAEIWRAVEPFKPSTALDLFSGSGAVSYMLKAQGIEVVSNDYMALSATFAKAMVQNNSETLSPADLDFLCSKNSANDGFVAKTFAGLYFTHQENRFMDSLRANIRMLDSEIKQVLARAALIRACMKKRPRGIFTYTGFRYDDGRKDLQLTLQEHFLLAAQAINAAVFDNGKANRAIQGDAMTCDAKADLVYIDPPYFSPLSDNEYVRRYHFVEGLARDWNGVEIQAHTKTRKFKGYPTPFSTLKGAEEALDLLCRRHRDAVLVVSYSSNSLPTKETITSIMARYKDHVDVISLDHRYSFGNQPHKTGNKNNKVSEYLFIGA